MNWLCAVLGHRHGRRYQPVDAHALLRASIALAIRTHEPGWMPRGYSDADLAVKVEQLAKGNG